MGFDGKYPGDDGELAWDSTESTQAMTANWRGIRRKVTYSDPIGLRQISAPQKMCTSFVYGNDTSGRLAVGGTDKQVDRVLSDVTPLYRRVQLFTR